MMEHHTIGNQTGRGNANRLARSHRSHRLARSHRSNCSNCSNCSPVGCRPPEALIVAGVPVTPFDGYDHALRCVEGAMRSAGKSFWVAVNPQKVHRCWHDRRVASLLRRATAGICDGVGVSLAAAVLLRTRLRRCTGCDLFGAIMPLAAERGWRIFLLGASPQSNELACRRLRQDWPGLQIVGRRDGYFQDDAEVVRQINDSGAEMLFVAMGSPRQELWIDRNIGQIDARFFMGIGGTLDVVSGIGRRAPAWMRRAGMEFLYQLVTQPRRWTRQIAYVPFTLGVLAQAIWGPDYCGLPGLGGPPDRRSGVPNTDRRGRIGNERNAA